MAMSLLHVAYHTPSTNAIGLDAQFVNGRSYLVFLEKNPSPYSKAPYRNLQTIGSYWDVNLPHPDWRPDPNGTIRDTIKSLVSENLDWRERALAGERSTFNEVFETEGAEQEPSEVPAEAAGP